MWWEERWHKIAQAWQWGNHILYLPQHRLRKSNDVNTFKSKSCKYCNLYRLASQPIEWLRRVTIFQEFLLTRQFLCNRQCEKCLDWFHMDCIGITESEADSIDQYYCIECCGIWVGRLSIGYVFTSFLLFSLILFPSTLSTFIALMWMLFIIQCKIEEWILYTTVGTSY